MNGPESADLQDESAASRGGIAGDPAQESAVEPAGDAVETGMRLYTRGLRSTAIRFYRRAIEDDPMNALAYYMLGLALKDLGQDEDAYIAWRTAAALSDPSPEHAWVRERAGGLLDMCAQPTSPSAA